MTELIFKNHRYQDSKINLLSAHDVGQAVNFLRTEEIAIAIIEVDSKMGKRSGLDFVNIVRNKINNNDIRLILDKDVWSGELIPKSEVVSESFDEIRQPE